MWDDVRASRELINTRENRVMLKASRFVLMPAALSVLLTFLIPGCSRAAVPGGTPFIRLDTKKAHSSLRHRKRMLEPRREVDCAGSALVVWKGSNFDPLLCGLSPPVSGGRAASLHLYLLRLKSLSQPPARTGRLFRAIQFLRYLECLGRTANISRRYRSFAKPST
jgi:hypothetical protein